MSGSQQHLILSSAARGFLEQVWHSITPGRPDKTAAIRRPDRGLIIRRIKGSGRARAARQVKQVNVFSLQLRIRTSNRETLSIKGKPGVNILSCRANRPQFLARAIKPGELLASLPFQQD